MSLRSSACLRNPYLFTIDENRVKPEARDDVVLFQRECAKALADYFRSKRAGGALPPAVTQLHRGAIVESVPSVSPLDAQRVAQIGEIAEQMVQMTGVIGFLREHMQALLTLPGQVEAMATQLSQALTLLETLAGRQEATETQLAEVDQRMKGLTPAHKRAIIDQVQGIVKLTRGQAVPLTYPTIYGPLNRRYHAASYAEIPDQRFDDAINFLQRCCAGQCTAKRQRKEHSFDSRPVADTYLLAYGRLKMHEQTGASKRWQRMYRTK